MTINQAKNCLNNVKDINKSSIENNIYIAEWDNIFKQDSTNKAYLNSAKLYLDSLRTKSTGEDNKRLQEVDSLYKLYKQKYNNLSKDMKSIFQKQIEHFSKLMKDLKADDGYELLFDDVYKIGEWIDKAEKCEWIDKNDKDYIFVKECNKYYVDFVKILVNNSLKTNLSNKDRYNDTGQEYIINKHKGINQFANYTTDSPFRQLIYEKWNKMEKGNNKDNMKAFFINYNVLPLMDDCTGKSYNDEPEKRRKIQQKQLEYILNDNSNKKWEKIDSFHSFYQKNKPS